MSEKIVILWCLGCNISCISMYIRILIIHSHVYLQFLGVIGKSVNNESLK